MGGIEEGGQLKCSNVISLPGGDVKAFPTLDDYVAFYQARGYVKDKAELLTGKKQLLPELFYNWMGRLATGCYFAARFSKHPASSGIETFSIPHALSRTDLAKFLNEILDLAASQREAALIMFPDVFGPHDIVTLINALCADSRWYWADQREDGQPDTSTLVGLRWKLPGGDSVNHVLGFAEIDSMPLTRRAPITALVMRIRDDKRTGKKKENGLIQVHLADMDPGVPEEAKFKRLWAKTEDLKRRLVAQQDAHAARARVTFAIEKEVARLLARPTIVTTETVGQMESGAP